MLTRRAAQARYSRTGQTVTNRSEPESKLNAKSKLDAKSDDKKNSPEAAQNKIKSHVKSTTRFEPKPKPCNNSTPNQTKYISKAQNSSKTKSSPVLKSASLKPQSKSAGEPVSSLKPEYRQINPDSNHHSSTINIPGGYTVAKVIPNVPSSTIVPDSVGLLYHNSMDSDVNVEGTKNLVLTVGTGMTNCSDNSNSCIDACCQTDRIWVHMENGLVDKVLEKEREIEQLKQKIATLELHIQFRDACTCGPPSPRFITEAVCKTCGAVCKTTAAVCETSTAVWETKTNNTCSPSLPTQNTRLDKFTCHIVGDSHVRGLASELSTIMPQGVNTEAVFLPGVGFHGLADQHVESPNLVTPGQDDCVVMLCGTNDICSTEWDTIQNALDILTNKFAICKMFCVVGVPYRFDNKKLNFHIKRFNTKLRSYLRLNMPNLVFLDPIKFIKSKDYIRDGLHLNKKGKNKLCKRIKLNILDTYLGSNPGFSEEVAKKVTIINDPARIGVNHPIPSNHDSGKDDYIDLIDLTDIPQVDGKVDESYFSDVMRNTVLFPDSTIGNNCDKKIDSEVPKTPSLVSTPLLPNQIDTLLKNNLNSPNNCFYQLTHVSMNSFTRNESYCSPITTINQNDLVFHNTRLTNRQD